MPTAAEALKQVFEEREQRGKEFRLARVTGRNSDGTEQWQRLDGECIGHGAAADHYTGEVIRIEPFPARQDGFTGLGGALRMSGLAVLWVDSLDPNVLAKGATYTVTVTGRGFTEATRIDFLLDETGLVNPDITIDETVFVSDTELSLQITVASGDGVVVLDEMPISYDNV